MIIGAFVVEFLVKSIRIRSFRREQLHPLGFFKLVTHKEGITECCSLGSVGGVKQRTAVSWHQARSLADG